MEERVYLDYNASTPLAPEVIEVMKRLLRESFGNPSSHHWAGDPARSVLARSRQQVADLLGCADQEVVFTSGGTEANNAALKGAFYYWGLPFHLVISAVEHPAIIKVAHFLEKLGATTTVVPVDGTGRVSVDDVARALRPDTKLLSIMLANNEVGTLQPIAELGHLARTHGVWFHTDAAQAVGKIPVDVRALGVDMLSVAGHKLYAPKGTGALYVREGITLEPFLHGADHENGRRAGTESVLLTAGLGTACEVARQLLETPSRTRFENLPESARDYFWRQLSARFDVVLNGHPDERLPNTLNVSFPGKVAADLLRRMPLLAASTGSACHSGAVALSPVLRAMGVSPHVGMGAIRFSLGRATTTEDIDRVVEWLAAIV